MVLISINKIYCKTYLRKLVVILQTIKNFLYFNTPIQIFDSEIVSNSLLSSLLCIFYLLNLFVFYTHNALSIRSSEFTEEKLRMLLFIRNSRE